MIDLSISIVTRELRLIMACLRSIFEKAREIEIETHVVVNCPESSDAIVSAIRDQFPQAHVTVNERAEGFSRSNNRNLRNCRGRYLLLLNDDTVVLRDALEQMVRFMDVHPDVGALGCRLLNPDGSPQWSCGSSAVHKLEYFRAGVLRTLLSPLVRDQLFDSERQVSWVTGACMLVRREAVEKVGLLDETFYMYYEDGEWCYRIIRGGWKVVYFPNAVVIHYRGQTSKQFAARMVTAYYHSRLHFFGKHFSLPTCAIVRALTVVDAIVGYVKSLRRSHAAQRGEMLKAYLGAIKLALTWRSS